MRAHGEEEPRHGARGGPLRVPRVVGVAGADLPLNVVGNRRETFEGDLKLRVGASTHRPHPRGEHATVRFSKYTRALRLLANSTRMGKTAAGDRAEKSPTQGRRRWDGEGAVSAAAKAVVALTWNGLSKRAGLSRTVTLVTLTQALRGCECTGGGERTRRGPARARAGGASARRACRRPSLVSQRT